MYAFEPSDMLVLLIKFFLDLVELSLNCILLFLGLLDLLVELVLAFLALLKLELDVS